MGAAGIEVANGALPPECVTGALTGTLPIVVGAVVTTRSTVCVVVEMTWPTGLGVVVAICSLALLAAWLIALAACLDTGPTVLSAAPVVFWSALVVDVVSALTVVVVTRGVALTVLSTGATED